MEFKTFQTIKLESAVLRIKMEHDFNLLVLLKVSLIEKGIQ